MYVNNSYRFAAAFTMTFCAGYAPIADCTITYDITVTDPKADPR